MKKKYKEIEFGLAIGIKEAIEELNKHKEKNELVFGIFNGEKLFSDIDDLNSAYKKITGKTKSEFDNYIKKQQDDYEEEQRKYKEAIPELTKEYIEKGKNILDDKYLELWNKFFMFSLFFFVIVDRKSVV